MRSVKGKHLEKRGGNILPALCSLIGTVLIIGDIILLLPLSVLHAFGFDAYHVISGSMAPAIPQGSMVLVHDTAPETVDAGDVIAFESDGTVVTHRVLQVIHSERQFVTKGDANETEDFIPVPFSSLLGRVEYSIPLLGKVCASLSTPRGKLYLLALLISGVLFRLLAGVLCSSQIAR